MFGGNPPWFYNRGMHMATRRDRYRLYPTEEQKALLLRILGCVRFVYNQCISYAQYTHEGGRPYPGYYGPDGFASLITTFKRSGRYDWLKEADVSALQNAARHADRAYRSLFAHRTEHPTFKSKRQERQTYETSSNRNSVRIEDERIRLPKVGFLKFRGKVRPHVRILSATVEHAPSGRWYCSLCVEVDLDVRSKKTHGSKQAGMDLGIRSYATIFDGEGCEHIENPKALDKHLERLAKEQRRLCRMRSCETKAMKALGVHSNNYERQRRKVARMHERISDIRRDFLHKLSRRLAVENQALVVETLDVRGMLEKGEVPGLSRMISDASWGAFMRMLEYKCDETGCRLVKVERSWPSTELCSYCGHLNQGIALSRRRIVCPVCHTVYDRDENAARNLYKRRPNAENGPAAGTVVGMELGAPCKPVETKTSGASENRRFKSGL